MMTTAKRKILLYQGGRYIHLEKTYNYFENILSDYIIDCFNSVEIFGTENFFEYGTTIFFSQEGKFTEEQEKNVLEFVAGGKGFIGLHGASASFKTHTRYFEMLGGRFISHKSVTNFDVNIIDKTHKITQGIENFTFKDEPYRHDFSKGMDIHILAEANYHDNNNPMPEPIMWIKTYGTGRVFYCALGHRTISLKDVMFQTIIKRAVRWVLAD
jgi:type 1 glutamine amidotransferase